MYKFALDIGTRKVAGIIGELDAAGKMTIKAAVVKEHDKRAMIDGQIHNVEAVSRIVNEIRHELELRSGIVLTHVNTALAGRNLVTELTEASAAKKGEITREDLFSLELESVRKGLAMAREKRKDSYFCVGFSPVYYTVDGAQIKDPMQHIARESIGISTITTFLPRQVFESMAAVVKNCGLVMESITLEPIAALYVTIPEDTRLLNLALIDVGAGTSDIAITDKSRITAYGMIPKAGDEITEEICRVFLTDFPGGEKIKRGISRDGVFGSDIFGAPFRVSYEEFAAAAGPKAEEIAKEISDEILSLNGKQPQAVVMVGGGSGLAVLREKIAENLGLPVSRVGLRMPSSISWLNNLPAELAGSDGITPIGILHTALYGKGLGFVEAYLNGEKVHVINLEQDIKVSDLLLARGIELKSLYGRPGAALTYTFNGELSIIRGTKGEHSRIFVNNEEKGLDAAVQKGDKVFMSGKKDGSDAQACVKDLIPQAYFLDIFVNSKAMNVPPLVMMNGSEVSMEEQVPDRAGITAVKRNTVREVAGLSGFVVAGAEERDILITVNGEPVSVKQRNFRMRVNGSEVGPDFTLKDGDKVELDSKPSYYKIKDILKDSLRKKVKVRINGRPFELESELYEVKMNGRKVNEEEFIINGAEIEVKQAGENIMLSSVFRVYPLDREAIKGKMVQLTVGGEKAGYTTQIKDGDEIEIKFV